MAFKRAFKSGVAPYLGIPWVPGGDERSGCDCWGLVHLVYREELGLDIAHPAELDTLSAMAAAARLEATGELVLGEARLRPVSPWEAVDLDVIEMALAGSRPDHVGVMAGGMVLHSRVRVGSHRAPPEACRIIGAWRLVAP